VLEREAVAAPVRLELDVPLADDVRVVGDEGTDRGRRSLEERARDDERERRQSRA
jgi:hypothetical protein